MIDRQTEDRLTLDIKLLQIQTFVIFSACYVNNLLDLYSFMSSVCYFYWFLFMVRINNKLIISLSKTSPKHFYF